MSPSSVLLLLLIGVVTATNSVRGKERSVFEVDPTTAEANETEEVYQINMKKLFNYKDGLKQREFAIFPFSMKQTEVVTICLFINFMYTFTDLGNVLFTLNDQLSAQAFYNLIQVTNVVNFSGYMSNASLHRGIWHHLCVTLGNEFVLYVDAKYYELVPNPALTGRPFLNLTSGDANVSIGNRIYNWLGDDLTVIMTSYGMKFTRPKVFFRKLFEYEVALLSACGEIEDALSLQDHTAWRQGRTSDDWNLAKLDSVVENHCLPSSDYRFVLVKKSVTYKEAKQACKRIGGNLARFENVNKHLVLEELLVTKSRLVFWVKQEDSMKCFMLLTSYKPRIRSQLIATACLETVILTHLGCEFETRSSIFIKSNNTKYEARVRVDVDANGNWFFSSTHQKYIEYSQNQNCFLFRPDFDSEEMVKSTSLTGNVAPVGRIIWTNFDGQRINMLVTSCSKKEFTCNNGDCVPIGSRCNGVVDCIDQSDEEHCTILLPLSNSHNVAAPPSSNFGLKFTIDEIKVTSVKINTGIVTALIQTTSEWTDDRNTYIQLNDDILLNKVDTSDHPIWQPDFKMKPLLFQDKIRFNREKPSIVSTLVKKTHSSNCPVLADTYEGVVTGGVVKMRDITSARFTCDFSLFYVPFSVFTCQLSFAIKHIGPLTPHYSKNATETNIEVPQQLQMIIFRDFKTNFFNKTATRTMAIKMFFASKYGSFIYTLFLPSFILNGIGNLTFSFDLNNFRDRIMVTLSCLIVVASIFSQAAGSFPSNGSPKLMDVYFLYVIFKLFMGFVYHTRVCQKMKQTSDPLFVFGKSRDIIFKICDIAFRKRKIKVKVRHSTQLFQKTQRIGATNNGLYSQIMTVSAFLVDIVMITVFLTLISGHQTKARNEFESQN